MSTNKRNFEKESLENTKVGILGMVSRGGGGVFQYTYSLVEALTRYSKYKDNLYIVVKDKEFDTQNLAAYPAVVARNLIVLKRKSTSLILKILKALSVEIPSTKKIFRMNGGYKIIRNSINLIINPIISLIPLYINKPYIVTIHDFQHKYHPRFFTLKERLVRNFVYKNIVKNAIFVVCESQFVKKDIVKFLNIHSDKIKVIQSPPPSYLIDLKIQKACLREIASKYRLPKKFLFYPAQFWYHKNHISLIRAISLLRKKYKKNVYLVLVGSRKNNFKNTMNEIKKLDLENQIKYLGYVSDQDMLYLYKLSTALMMPTLFESISLPIWEAFYLGCPVIASDICALPEQVQDAGLLFNPRSVEDIAEKIYKIWTDENLRVELVKKGYERIKLLTFENYAKQWEKLIDEAFDKINEHSQQ